jgi:hypothetical protein
VDNAAKNMSMQMSLLYLDLRAFAYAPSSGIAGLVVLFLVFIEELNLYTTFHNSCTNLHSYQQCRRVPFSPRPRKYLLFFVFLVIAILTGMRWNANVVLICFFSLARDVEHFFWSFVLLPLKNFCSFYLPISSLDH